MREMVKAEDVTRRMKAIRVSKGMTLQDVGDKMGKTKAAVSAQERNPLGLSVSTLIEYASIYGCEVADFFMPDRFSLRKENTQV